MSLQIKHPSSGWGLWTGFGVGLVIGVALAAALMRSSPSGDGRMAKEPSVSGDPSSADDAPGWLPTEAIQRSAASRRNPTPLNNSPEPIKSQRAPNGPNESLSKLPGEQDGHSQYAAQLSAAHDATYSQIFASLGVSDSVAAGLKAKIDDIARARLIAADYQTRYKFAQREYELLLEEGLTPEAYEAYQKYESAAVARGEIKAIRSAAVDSNTAFDEQTLQVLEDAMVRTHIRSAELDDPGAPFISFYEPAIGNIQVLATRERKASELTTALGKLMADPALLSLSDAQRLVVDGYYNSKIEGIRQSMEILRLPRAQFLQKLHEQMITNLQARGARLPRGMQR